GQTPDPAEFLARAPDLFEELREFFADQGRLSPLLTPLRPPPPSPPEPACAGQRVGPCELVEEIGRGGMGAVLKGRDARLGRDVAVKVLRQTHAGNDDLARRFVEEARIAGRLQHPGVVPVYDLGQFPDERPYFTMKLVEGRTLAQLLAARTDRAQD